VENSGCFGVTEVTVATEETGERSYREERAVKNSLSLSLNGENKELLATLY